MCYLKTMFCQEGRVYFIQSHKHLLSNPKRGCRYKTYWAQFLPLGRCHSPKTSIGIKHFLPLTSRSLFFLGSPPASLGQSFLVPFAESQILVLSSVYTQIGDLTQFNCHWYAFSYQTYIALEFQIHISNYLLNISTWVSNMNLKFNMSNSKLVTSWTSLQHTSLAPILIFVNGSSISSFAQTKNCGIILKHFLIHITFHLSKNPVFSIFRNTHHLPIFHTLQLPPWSKLSSSPSWMM